AIDTSVQYLDGDQRRLLSGLWIFNAPFLPEVAASIFDAFDPNIEQRSDDERSPVMDWLNELWGRGLLTRSLAPVRDADVLMYRLLPTVRLYVERYMEKEHPRDDLLTAFGRAYAGLADLIERGLNRSAALV